MTPSAPSLPNHWYAVAHEGEVDPGPLVVRLLGERYVLFRDEQGRCRAFHDVCAHRAASFASGWVENGCLRCPYHGWTYGADGACRLIPADDPGTAIPARARLHPLPVQQASGFLWLFPGEPSLADADLIPPLPEYDQPGWRVVRGEYTWNAHFSRVVEAGLDTSHAPFVHKPFFPNRNDAAVGPLTIHEESDRVWTHQQVKPPQRMGLLKYILRKDRPFSSSTLTSYLPAVNRIHLDFNWRGFQYIYFASNIPESEGFTRTKWIGLRNFLPQSWADGNSIRNTVTTYEEDRAVVEAQPPGPSWGQHAPELLLASDHLILAYRKRVAAMATLAS
ncbi:aromatic ring-hydroxylating dioxygenase subunit alpha [Synechococcus sp. RSCCF101]|uniref:aromatic ring-hydroxylating dioxygenase subunit alpha n=1 Tax=Synechococcus sp. RSCCF101 TaxID=2511069 RepID=UPI0012462808|nr:aromatic ring-hydroxylating dioxygenase subunit alpha [Synechococcus sp. RSCCF101]QEY32508.1 aromatic ring-hydroxylating dioxygenase subunit alpha [Synechococcus sp. RSCCF101]